MAWWNLFSLFLVIGVTAGSIVIGFMLYFIFKYRYIDGKPEVKRELAPARTHVREAIILASISGIILFSLAIVSYRASAVIQYPPSAEASLVIEVTAFQWDFKFKYPNNVTLVGECRVPADSVIVFNVTSSDVFHNFGLPQFRLKIDAIPGVYNTLWIQSPPLDGNTQLQYRIICYELCGEGHSFMQAKLTVMDPSAFTTWLNQTNMTMPGM